MQTQVNQEYLDRLIQLADDVQESVSAHEIGIFCQECRLKIMKLIGFISALEELKGKK